MTITSPALTNEKPLNLKLFTSHGTKALINPIKGRATLNKSSYQLQWGLKFRTFEYRIHSKTETFHVLY